jgi:hypothetical protein
MATRIAVSADITPTVISTSDISTRRKNLRMTLSIVARIALSLGAPSLLVWENMGGRCGCSSSTRYA